MATVRDVRVESVSPLRLRPLLEIQRRGSIAAARMRARALRRSVVSAAEILRAHGSARATVWRRGLEVAALPPPAATGVVVLARLAPLVG